MHTCSLAIYAISQPVAQLFGVVKICGQTQIDRQIDRLGQNAENSDCLSGIRYRMFSSFPFSFIFQLEAALSACRHMTYIAIDSITMFT